jgi:hypothetical protein
MKEPTQVEIPTGMKYRSLVCAMAVNLLIGSYYTYSNMYMYVGNYLKIYNPWLDDENNKVKMIMPIWIIVQSCVAVLSVRIAEKIGYRTLNFIAFSWFTLNNVAMIFVKDFYVYVMVYGVSNGIAIGLGYLPALYTAWTYFPDKKSVATGVILFCAGMSASISSPIVTFLVNPDNLPVNDPKVTDKVPYLWTCLTCGYAAITLIACSFQPAPFESEALKQKKQLQKKLGNTENKQEKKEIEGRIRGMSVVGAFNNQITQKDMEVVNKELFSRNMGPQDAEGAFLVGTLNNNAIEDIVHNTGVYTFRKTDIAGLEKFAEKHHHGDKEDSLIGDKDQADEIYRLSREIQEQACPSFTYGITSKTFLMLGVMSFCCSIYNYFLLLCWKKIFQTKLSMGDKELSFLLTVGAVANSSFRIISGVLLLKLTFKTLYYTLVSVMILGAFTFDSVVSQTMSPAIGSIYLFFAFAGLGTMVTIFPTICVKAFGSDVGSKLYPVIYLCFSMSNLTCYLITSYLTNFEVMFYIFGGFAVIGLLTGLIFDPEPSWHQAMVDQANKDHQKLEQAKASIKS